MTDPRPQVELLVPWRTLLKLFVVGSFVALTIVALDVLLSIFVAIVLALGLDSVVAAPSRRSPRGRARRGGHDRVPRPDPAGRRDAGRRRPRARRADREHARGDLTDSLGVGSTRDPDIEAIAGHLRQADVLDPAELRELIPSLLMLEGVAVRDSPPFDDEAIAALRDANRRLRDSAGDAAAAALADDEFHRRLTAGCANSHLLELVDLTRKALLSYERLYMLSPERLAQSVEEHDAIVAALEQGDHALAADRVRENFTSGLPGLEAPLEDRERSQ